MVQHNRVLALVGTRSVRNGGSKERLGVRYGDSTHTRQRTCVRVVSLSTHDNQRFDEPFRVIRSYYSSLLRSSRNREA